MDQDLCVSRCYQERTYSVRNPEFEDIIYSLKEQRKLSGRMAKTVMFIKNDHILSAYNPVAGKEATDPGPCNCTEEKGISQGH